MCLLKDSGLTSKYSGEDASHPNCLSLLFQDDKDGDMCEEDDLDGNTANNSNANRKRQLWWESRQGTDEKNVRQGSHTHEQLSIYYWTGDILILMN